MAETYPFSVTFHGKDIVEVRGAMVNFLADNVTPGVQEQSSPPKSQKSKAKRKPPAKKSAKSVVDDSEPAPSVSTDTDTETDSANTPGEITETPTNSGTSPDVTPEEHPNVSLAYNNALEQLMDIYNGSPEGSYEVTVLLEQYRVASFREIPEDRGVELLGKAEEIAAAMAAKEST